MMNLTRQHKFAALLLSCAIVCTGMVHNRTKSNEASSLGKKALTQRPLNSQEKQIIDDVFEKMIEHTHAIGKWLEDLFDTENNVSYAEHVKDLKKIVKSAKQHFVVSFESGEEVHSTIQATYHVAILLLKKVENTYTVLESYCGSNYPFVHYGLGMALKKVLNSSKDQVEFDASLQDLHAELENVVPELNAKLNDLKATIKLYGARINSNGWRTLTNGLSHRLGCEEQK